MTHIVPISLPIRFQAIRVPVRWKWEMASKPWIRTVPDESDKWLFYAEAVKGAARPYDPWQLRDEFLRLRPAHDPKPLMQFLDKVGMFDNPELEDANENPHILGGGYSVKVGAIQHEFRSQARRDYAYFWEMQDCFVRAMGSRTRGVFDAPGLPLRFRHGRGEFYAEITAPTFMDAVITTIEIDHLRGAKFRKCARPDCGTVFSAMGRRSRKYCRWYCGHLESVRKQRRSKKVGGKANVNL